jgi:hypothetical protein
MELHSTTININQPFYTIKLHLINIFQANFNQKFDPHNVCTYHLLCPNTVSLYILTHTPHRYCGFTSSATFLDTVSTQRWKKHKSKDKEMENTRVRIRRARQETCHRRLSLCSIYSTLKTKLLTGLSKLGCSKMWTHRNWKVDQNRKVDIIMRKPMLTPNRADKHTAHLDLLA